MARARKPARNRSASSNGKRPPKDTLGRDHWIAAAKAELIAKGVAAVKVDRLARRLRVTRGSFYWHFKNRADLLRALLSSWEENNTRPFERIVESTGPRDAMKEFLGILHLWLDEQEYSPAFDTAVRDWARVSRAAAAATHRADERRIEVLRRVFLDLGYEDPEALVRARVTYFHQVGYYALAIRDEPKSRRALAPMYAQVLLGHPSDLLSEAFKSVNSSKA